MGFPSVDSTGDPFRLAAVDYLQKPINIQERLVLVGKATQKQHLLYSGQKTRQETQEFTETLEYLESCNHSSGSGNRSPDGRVTVSAYFDLVVGYLASVSMVLRHLIDRLIKGKGSLREVLDHAHSICPGCSRYRETLYRTTQVLTKTKVAFKSKALGELRREIEHIFQVQ